MSDKDIKDFNEVKIYISNVKRLDYYNPNLSTFITSDASRSGLGFALLQIDDTAKLHLIKLGSCSLTDTQSRYSITELEALALCFGINSCKYYLKGNYFISIVDHRPLLGLKNKELCDFPSERLFRIFERTKSYNYDIKYIVGLSNFISDSLSRHPENRYLSKSEFAFLFDKKLIQRY